MGKLCLYYKKHEDAPIGNILKVKVDDSITFEVNRDEIYELDLEDGNHNIKMYYEGWSKNELVGYIDKYIEINGNTYYMYKGPLSIYGKGKLTKHDYNSPDEFKKTIKKDIKKNKIVGAILLLLAFIIYLLAY